MQNSQMLHQLGQLRQRQMEMMVTIAKMISDIDKMGEAISASSEQRSSPFNEEFTCRFECGNKYKYAATRNTHERKEHGGTGKNMKRLKTFLAKKEKEKKLTLVNGS